MEERLPRPFENDQYVDPNRIDGCLSSYTLGLVSDLSSPDGITIWKARKLLFEAVAQTRERHSPISLFEAQYLWKCSFFVIENLRKMKRISDDEFVEFVKLANSSLEEDYY